MTAVRESRSSPQGANGGLGIGGHDVTFAWRRQQLGGFKEIGGVLQASPNVSWLAWFHGTRGTAHAARPIAAHELSTSSKPSTRRFAVRVERAASSARSDEIGRDLPRTAM